MMIFLIILFSQSIIEVKTTVDKQEITVGDYIKYQVEIKLTEGIKIELPKVKKLGNFEVIDKQEEKEENSINFIYTLTTFKTGADTIPSLSFKYIDKEKNECTAETEPVVIKIKSVLTKGIQDVKDINSPVSIPQNLTGIIIGIILFCILVGIGYWIIQKKKRFSKLLSINKKPCHIIAYEKLKSLQFKNGNIKEYYIELSDIIRKYIEERYAINAPTETTFELYRKLRAAKVEYAKIELINDFLSKCDLVKFAKYIPSIESAEKDKEFAKDIIDKTKIAEFNDKNN